MSGLEIAANSLNAVSIVLAGRNRVHTWWTGILGCVLFGWLFYEAKLYADSTLQVFFIATSAAGWWAWVGRRATGQPRPDDPGLEPGRYDRELPIARTGAVQLAAMAAAAVAVAVVYGWMLHRFTDAWQPFADSLVLTGSVLAQLLLMARRIETWPCWLLVDTIAVPLFWARGLHVTSALYAAFWLNALVSFVHWRRLMRATPA